MSNQYTWYSEKIDAGSPDSIHQVLAFGSLEDVRALKEKLGEATLQKLFISHPKKVYSAPALNFIKKFVLRIPDSIDEQQYLKHTPRHIG